MVGLYLGMGEGGGERELQIREGKTLVGGGEAIREGKTLAGGRGGIRRCVCVWWHNVACLYQHHVCI